MCGIHHRVNMYVSGQVLASVMPVFISRPACSSTCGGSCSPSPLSDCLLCQILVYSQTAEWQPFTEPRFYGNIHPPWQTDDPPSPPTHSVDSIQETTNTPTKLFPHRGLVCLTSAESVKTLSAVEFRRGRDRRSYALTRFHTSVESINHLQKINPLQH